MNFARSHTVLEEAALHWVARQGERLAEVLARVLEPAAPKLHVAESREVERVFSEAVAVDNRPNFFEPALGTRLLRDGNGAIERDDGGRTYGH